MRQSLTESQLEKLFSLPCKLNAYELFEYLTLIPANIACKKFNKNHDDVTWDEVQLCYELLISKTVYTKTIEETIEIVRNMLEYEKNE